MKNAVFVVFKKELVRFFSDKRLLFSTIILPALAIYLMYSIMGNAMSTSIRSENVVFTVAAVNMPDSLDSLFSEEKFSIDKTVSSDVDTLKDGIVNKKYSIAVIFPDNFEEILANGVAKDLQNVPNIQIYYNSSDMDSNNAFAQTSSILNSVEQKLSNIFNINYLESSADTNPYDVATKEETSGMVFAMILPMILMTMMYSSCMSFAVESIAGEKERGTIASMLITPTPRNQIITGKILALSIMALLGGLSTFLGTMLSMPKIANQSNDMGDIGNTFSAGFYKPLDYIFLILVIFSTIILFVTLISILSAFAKSVKEASSLAMPLMILVMIVGLTSINGNNAHTEAYWYAIPIYNSVQSMIGIFSFKVSFVNILITMSSNLLMFVIGIVILTKMFNNEKIMFNN